MIQPAMILLLASLAGGPGVAGPDGVICENRRIPVEVAESVYVIEHSVRCYRPGPGLLERVKLACDVLTSAYGEEEGRERCRELATRSGIRALEP